MQKMKKKTSLSYQGKYVSIISYYLRTEGQP